jgi:hypothetical protein
MLNLEQTCNNPHHDAPPDRNRVRGYRRGLASLSVVKELLFRVHRNVPTRDFWRDLPVRVARTRLPALLTSASAEFLLRILVALRLASGNPLRNFAPLVTRH